MRELRDKVAVITGGANGIGRGIALALAGAGVHVVVADIDEDGARAVCEEASALGPRAIAVQTDVTDRSSVEALAQRAAQEFGDVHILCNNAGVVIFQRLDAMTDAEWDRILAVNLHGVVNGLQAFLPLLKATAGERHIVNTASMAGLSTNAHLGAYNATKFAVVALSEVLREELHGEGIGVSVLCPGPVRTNILARASERHSAGDEAMPRLDLDASLLRIMEPEDVGRLVVRAIDGDEPYVLTHPEYVGAVRGRSERILAAFDEAAQRDSAAGVT